MAAARVLTDFENLPEDVKDKLAELDLELSEGEKIILAEAKKLDSSLIQFKMLNLT